MAKVGSVEFDATLNTKKVDDGIKKITGDANKGAATIEKAFQRAFLAIGAAITASAGIGINFNRQMETYQTSFEVMTGSYEKAADLVEELKTRAAATPFDLTDLADTTQLLMNYGFTTDNVISSMEMLGDIAQGDSEKLSRIALAYGQMTSAGKVTLQDVKQMIEAGFNPLQEIVETTGESMGSLYERISKGTISVDEITAAMKRSTSEGGKYFQSMDKQSQTLTGRWNTLKDTFAETTGTLTKGISDWLRDKGIPAASRALEWLTKNFEDLLPAIEVVVVAAAGFYVAFKFADIIKGIKDIGAALASSAGIAGMVTAAIGALVTVLAIMYAKANESSAYFKDFESRMNDLRTSIDNTATSVRDLETSFNETMLQSEMTAEKANAYLDVIDRISADGVLAADEQNDFNAAVAMLQTLYPDLQIEIDETTGLIKDGTQALRDQIEMMQQHAQAAALQSLVQQAYENQTAALNDMNRAWKEYVDASDHNQTFYRRHNEKISETNTLLGQNFKTVKECVDALSGWQGATADQTQRAQDLYDALLPLVATEEENRQAVTDSMEELGKAQGVYRDASLAVEGYEQAMSDAAATGDYSAVSIGKSYDKIVNKSHEMKSNVQTDATEAANAVANGGSGIGWGGAAGVATRELQNKFQPNLRRAGINAAQGAIDGMLSKLSELKSTAKYLASQVNGSFNAWLKIRSPSRVMMESGKFVVEGVAEGIEDAAHVAEKAAAKLGEDVEVAFDATPRMDNVAAGAALQRVQMQEVYSNISAQMQTAPVHVHVDVDGAEIASATALPMSYALESLRIAEARG